MVFITDFPTTYIGQKFSAERLNKPHGRNGMKCIYKVRIGDSKKRAGVYLESVDTNGYFQFNIAGKSVRFDGDIVTTGYSDLGEFVRESRFKEILKNTIDFFSNQDREWLASEEIRVIGKITSEQAEAIPWFGVF